MDVPMDEVALILAGAIEPVVVDMDNAEVEVPAPPDLADPLEEGSQIMFIHLCHHLMVGFREDSRQSSFHFPPSNAKVMGVVPRVGWVLYPGVELKGLLIPGGVFQEAFSEVLPVRIEPLPPSGSIRGVVMMSIAFGSIGCLSLGSTDCLFLRSICR
ncbi:uncharacterized protein LOC126661011 [Mercurialis annua]|uniref:uncharacterized protein LOC126661011 n=1 Tax=Mercurialis annua TaxID=3986 RepID=UPI00215E2FE7|nr:uncharacterized protein LOC126661011 [Mercurialis annua]